MKKVEKTFTFAGVEFNVVCFNAEGKSVNKWNGTRKCFDIYISVGENRKKFKFYDSLASYPKSADERTLFNCLDCVISDAIGYGNCYNLADFCNEFGIEKHLEGLNAYRGCQRAYFFFEDCGVDIYEVSNAINDMVNEE